MEDQRRPRKKRLPVARPTFKWLRMPNELNRIALRLNQRPRKTLGFETAACPEFEHASLQRTDSLLYAGEAGVSVRVLLSKDGDLLRQEPTTRPQFCG
jgi:hypothetical protein